MTPVRSATRSGQRQRVQCSVLFILVLVSSLGAIHLFLPESSGPPSSLFSRFLSFSGKIVPLETTITLLFHSTATRGPTDEEQRHVEQTLVNFLNLLYMNDERVPDVSLKTDSARVDSWEAAAVGGESARRDEIDVGGSRKRRITADQNAQRRALDSQGNGMATTPTTSTSVPPGDLNLSLTVTFFGRYMPSPVLDYHHLITVAVKDENRMLLSMMAAETEKGMDYWTTMTSVQVKEGTHNVGWTGVMVSVGPPMETQTPPPPPLDKTDDGSSEIDTTATTTAETEVISEAAHETGETHEQRFIFN